MCASSVPIGKWNGELATDISRVHALSRVFWPQVGRLVGYSNFPSLRTRFLDLH